MDKLNSSEKAVIDLFDMDYNKKISVRNVIRVGGESALRSLIEKDKIYCSDTNTLSLVSILFFGINKYCNTIASVVDNKGYMYIDNLFGETGSNKRGYEAVKLLRSSGYIVNVVVNDLKASATVFSESKYITDAHESHRLSKEIGDLELNKKVYKILGKIGKKVQKASNKGEFHLFYRDVGLYKNNNIVTDAVIKKLESNGYHVLKTCHNKGLLNMLFGSKYGINISWQSL